MNDLYRAHILDHYKHPRNSGVLSTSTIIQEEINPSCGDKTTLSLQIENNTLVDLKHNTTGCALSVAAMSLLSEYVKGKTLSQIKQIKSEDLFLLLGIHPGPVRLKCVLLALSTLQHAVRRYDATNK